MNKVVLSTTCKQLGTKSLLLGLAFLHTCTGCRFHSLIQIIANVFTVAECFALTKIYSSEIYRKIKHDHADINQHIFCQRKKGTVLLQSVMFLLFAMDKIGSKL